MPPFSKAYICCIRNIHPEFPPLLPLYVPGGSVVKNLPASAGDTGLIPRKRRSPGEGNGNPCPQPTSTSALVSPNAGLANPL